MYAIFIFIFFFLPNLVTYILLLYINFMQSVLFYTLSSFANSLCFPLSPFFKVVHLLTFLNFSHSLNFSSTLFHIHLSHSLLQTLHLSPLYLSWIHLSSFLTYAHIPLIYIPFIHTLTFTRSHLSSFLTTGALPYPAESPSPPPRHTLCGAETHRGVLSQDEPEGET